MPRVYLPAIIWHSKGEKIIDRVYSIDWQPGTHRLVTSGADEFIHIWQIDRKHSEGWKPKCVSRLLGHEQEINCVRWSPDGLILASGGTDKNVFLWKLDEKPDCVPLGYEDCMLGMTEFWSRAAFYRCTEAVNTLCWCPSSPQIAVALEDSKILILAINEFGNLARLCTLEGHTNMVQGISWDPLNELLASQSCDQTLRIWRKKAEGKSWKIENVIRSAKELQDEKQDEGNIRISNEELGTYEASKGLSMQNNSYEKQRQNKTLFYPDSVLPSFFRRLDWSPDGTIIISPAGLQNLIHEEDISIEDASRLQHSTFASPFETGCDSTYNTASCSSPYSSLLGEKSFPLPASFSSPSHFSSPLFLSSSSHASSTEMSTSLNLKAVNKDSSKQSTTNQQTNKSGTSSSGGSNVISTTSSPSCSVAYVFHRKLLATSTPFATHRSNLGAPVAVRCNPVSFFPLAWPSICYAPNSGMPSHMLESHSWLFDCRDINSRFEVINGETIVNDATKPRKYPAYSSNRASFQPPVEVNFGVSNKVALPTSHSNSLASLSSSFSSLSLSASSSSALLLPSLQTNSKYSGKVQIRPQNLARHTHLQADEDVNYPANLLAQQPVHQPASAYDDDFYPLISNNHYLTPPWEGDLKHEEHSKELSGSIPEDKAFQPAGTRVVPIKYLQQEGATNSTRNVHPFSSPAQERSVAHGSFDSEHICVQKRQISTKKDQILPPFQYSALSQNGFSKQPVQASADQSSPTLYPRFLYAVGTVSGNLMIFDTQFFSLPIATLKNLHFAPITDLAWSDDGLILAASSSDGLITFVFFEEEELGKRLLNAGWFSRKFEGNLEESDMRIELDIGGSGKIDRGEVISKGKRDGMVRHHQAEDGVFIVGNAANG